ncbi:hypothetical protein VZH09_13930 (plasmid) [Synechococcus elongatus IITB7]|uniref:hypothetical protein n=1 Tax=Synechococcus elongatus TaxID=32046 RepID=UPI0030CF3AB4
MTAPAGDWLQLQAIAHKLTNTDPAEFTALPSLIPSICLLLQAEIAHCRETGDTEAAGIARAIGAIA